MHAHGEAWCVHASAPNPMATTLSLVSGHGPTHLLGHSAHPPKSMGRACGHPHAHHSRVWCACMGCAHQTMEGVPHNNCTCEWAPLGVLPLPRPPLPNMRTPLTTHDWHTHHGERAHTTQCLSLPCVHLVAWGCDLGMCKCVHPPWSNITTATPHNHDLHVCTSVGGLMAPRCMEGVVVCTHFWSCHVILQCKFAQPAPPLE